VYRHFPIRINNKMAEIEKPTQFQPNTYNGVQYYPQPQTIPYAQPQSSNPYQQQIYTEQVSNPQYAINDSYVVVSRSEQDNHMIIALVLLIAGLFCPFIWCSGFYFCLSTKVNDVTKAIGLLMTVLGILSVAALCCGLVTVGIVFTIIGSQISIPTPFPMPTPYPLPTPYPMPPFN